LHATPWGRPPARFASTIARTQRTPVTYMEPKTAPTETAVATENPAATHIGTAAEAKASATAI